MIDNVHTTLMILQLHTSFVRMAKHFRRNSKPGRPGVEHLVSNRQLHNKRAFVQPVVQPKFVGLPHPGQSVLFGHEH